MQYIIISFRMPRVVVIISPFFSSPLSFNFLIEEIDQNNQKPKGNPLSWQPLWILQMAWHCRQRASAPDAARMVFINKIFKTLTYPHPNPNSTTVGLMGLWLYTIQPNNPGTILQISQTILLDYLTTRLYYLSYNWLSQLAILEYLALNL